MKAKIKEIIEIYSLKYDYYHYHVIYESGDKRGYRDLPKTAQKWKEKAEVIKFESGAQTGYDVKTYGQKER